MDTVRQALAMLEREQVMTLVPVAGTSFRSLVAEIAGGPVKGSWWGHPRGKLIYRIATELEESGAVLTTKLVNGKVTFVHCKLWPPLLRIVTDAGWRELAVRGLTPAATTLLDEVQARGRVRLDGRADEAARKLLEARHLAVGSSEHTERGVHAAVLRSWEDWAAAAGAHAKVASGSMEDARAALSAVGLTIEPL